MSTRKPARSTPSPKKTSSRGSQRPSRGLIRADLLWIVLALMAGALLIPPMIWITGLIVIGPYANGGMWALWTDVGQALQQGSLAAWITLIAPAVLVAIWRLSWRWLRPR